MFSLPLLLRSLFKHCCDLHKLPGYPYTERKHLRMQFRSVRRWHSSMPSLQLHLPVLQWVGDFVHKLRRH